MPAEYYYRHLLDNSVDCAETHIECGSGCHSHPLDHELDPDVETLSDFDRTLLKRVVAAAVGDHQKTLRNRKFSARGTRSMGSNRHSVPKSTGDSN